jgi:hypothetical protein
MDVILKEIERALKIRLFYVAIVMCLTLPDICAALALRRSAEPVQVCSGKSGQSCYTIRRTILEPGRQELAGDSV